MQSKKKSFFIICFAKKQEADKEAKLILISEKLIPKPKV